MGMKYWMVTSCQRNVNAISYGIERNKDILDLVIVKSMIPMLSQMVTRVVIKVWNNNIGN